MNGNTPNDLLVRLEQSCRMARHTVLLDYVGDDVVGRKLIERILALPNMRALLELELNGCTSYQSARSLVAEGFARVATFKARAQLLRGRRCEYLELTDLGRMALFDEQEGLDGNKYLGLLKGAILGYACIDYGQGICVTRELLETSLELPDSELLKRVVLVGSGEEQFPELKSVKSLIDAQARAKASHWWSTLDVAERNSQIVDLAED